MDFDKKTVMAFLLIGLVLLLVYTPIYQKVFFPEAYKQKQLQSQIAEATPASSQIDSSKSPVQRKEIAKRQESGIPNFAPKNVIEQKAASRGDQSNELLGNSDEKENVISIETDLYSAKISNRGASLTEWILKEYEGLNNKPVTLLPEQAYGTLGVRFITKDGDSLSTKDWYFESDFDFSEKISINKSKIISFTADLNNGRKIIKEYEFFNGRYDFNLKIKLENLDDIIAEKKYFLEAPAGLLSTEKILKDDMYYSKTAISASQQVEKKQKASGKLESESGDIDWVAVRTKYFALAIAPLNRKGIAANIYGEEIAVPSEPKEKWKKFNINIEMPFLGNNNTQDQFLIYFGPIDDDILKEYNLGFQNIMDMGWVVIKPFSKGVLWSFKKLHSFIPNYGIVIILFSILIKLLLYPLTHKSFESMQRMKDLQPKLAELKEKFGKDAQRMQKETMALYKQEGVNPMGSCLPMVLQMPLLFALFQVFRSTIELRGEGFMLWITDLSLPDTIAILPFTIPFYGNTLNILPLLMGITMFMQQKMTITDPKQKAMVYIMPVFLTFLFNSFPSGLNLYYALFNVFSIIQQKYISPTKSSNIESVSAPKKKKL
jgi:YidC/Oxa1 family membrane protein insertase